MMISEKFLSERSDTLIRIQEDIEIAKKEDMEDDLQRRYRNQCR